MIVKREQLAVDQTAVERTQDQAPDPITILDSPPPYVPNNVTNQVSGSSTSAPSPTSSSFSLNPPPSATRCKYLRIRRTHFPVKGKYLVDPKLHVPVDVMPQLDPGQSEKDRPNLDFVSTHGWVNVDVWLAGAGREEAGTSSSAGNDVSVEAKSTFGSATVKLHANLTKQVVKVKIVSHSGATLVIPPTFTGPLVISSGIGWMNISNKVKARLTTFSEMESERICFVGDPEGFGSGEWQGSSAHIECSNGRARVMLSEEAEDINKSKNPFVRWFNGV